MLLGLSHPKRCNQDRLRPLRPRLISVVARGTTAVKAMEPRAASSACRRTRRASRSTWPGEDRAASGG